MADAHILPAIRGRRCQARRGATVPSGARSAPRRPRHTCRSAARAPDRKRDFRMAGTIHYFLGRVAKTQAQLRLRLSSWRDIKFTKWFPYEEVRDRKGLWPFSFRRSAIVFYASRVDTTFNDASRTRKLNTRSAPRGRAAAVVQTDFAERRVR